jgi:hypothetical protein
MWAVVVAALAFSPPRAVHRHHAGNARLSSGAVVRAAPANVAMLGPLDLPLGEALLSVVVAAAGVFAFGGGGSGDPLGDALAATVQATGAQGDVARASQLVADLANPIISFFKYNSKAAKTAAASDAIGAVTRARATVKTAGEASKRTTRLAAVSSASPELKKAAATLAATAAKLVDAVAAADAALDKLEPALKAAAQADAAAKAEAAALAASKAASKPKPKPMARAAAPPAAAPAAAPPPSSGGFPSINFGGSPSPASAPAKPAAVKPMVAKPSPAPPPKPVARAPPPPPTRAVAPPPPSPAAAPAPSDPKFERSLFGGRPIASNPTPYVPPLSGTSRAPPPAPVEQLANSAGAGSRASEDSLAVAELADRAADLEKARQTYTDSVAARRTAEVDAQAAKDAEAKRIAAREEADAGAAVAAAEIAAQKAIMAEEAMAEEQMGETPPASSA